MVLHACMHAFHPLPFIVIYLIHQHPFLSIPISNQRQPKSCQIYSGNENGSESIFVEKYWDATLLHSLVGPTLLEFGSASRILSTDQGLARTLCKTFSGEKFSNQKVQVKLFYVKHFLLIKGSQRSCVKHFHVRNCLINISRLNLCKIFLGEGNGYLGNQMCQKMKHLQNHELVQKYFCKILRKLWFDSSGNWMSRLSEINHKSHPSAKYVKWDRSK